MIKASLLVLLAACAVDDVSDIEAEPIAFRCPAFGCGVNTATGPDGQFFDVLDRTGVNPNEDGVRVSEFKLGSIKLKLEVELDRLVGVDKNGHRYVGNDLDGAEMQMSTPSGSFRVVFEDVDPIGIEFWAGTAKEVVEVYDLRVYAPNGQSAWACHEPVPGWAGRSYSAIAFEGDSYDKKWKTVTDDYGSTWFNLACAGSYEAKLHLLRHTYAGGFNDAGVRQYPTDPWQRQTYLKALTADFFGDGGTFTVTGTPLRYTDAAGFHPDNFTGARPEAYWDQDGAICLAWGLSRPPYVFTATPP